MDQQIFDVEQFAQIADRLLRVFLAGYRREPVINLAPWRRAADFHRLVNESARLAERRQALRLRLALHQ